MRDSELRALLDAKADREHYHYGLAAGIVLLFAFSIGLLIAVSSTQSSSTKDYSFDAKSFCEHYNMTYVVIRTPLGQEDIYECIKLNNDTVIEQKQIQDLGNIFNSKWVFK